MWQTRPPKPCKLIAGILAPDEAGLDLAVETLSGDLGPIDLASPTWPFEQTAYYEDQIGPRIFRRFVSFERLADPGDLAQIKHRTNAMERALAERLGPAVPRPVNLDPGLIETSKLVLASTKNFSHRIYIGREMYAEVTLIVDRGRWTCLPYTYPDYRLPEYHAFFERVRQRLREQQKPMTEDKR